MERYSDPQSFAREVNLPLIGIVRVTPILAGAQASTLLEATDPEGLKPAVEALTQTRKSLTLRSLFLTGFPHDPEFFAAGLALAREWSREGLKVAVVDLDYRHPTVVRPRPDPNEGYVDALEYGCSFQRIGWELVADSLWLVGPGSHPTDGERFAAHPDWARVMRIFSSRVDVTLYLAPFLDRKGFTGRLSKRMDGVLLAASVQRASRAALRDAFLELWGSDAPMIGCLGIAVPHVQPPKAAKPMDPVVSNPVPERTETRADASDIATGSRASSGPAPRRRFGETPVAESGDAAARALVTKLSDEVRQGRLPRVGRPRSRALLFAVVALVVAAGVVGAFVTSRMLRHRETAGAGETLPAGTERVLPADVGTANPQRLPQTKGASPGQEAPAGGPSTPPDGTSPAEETPSPPGGESGAPASGEPAVGTPAPTPSPPASAETRGALPYRVHIASFRSESKVREMVKSLRARGIGAWYAAATDQPGWYRVFVGHYATRKEAAQKAAWLLERGLVDRAMAYPDNER